MPNFFKKLTSNILRSFKQAFKPITTEVSQPKAKRSFIRKLIPKFFRARPKLDEDLGAPPAKPGVKVKFTHEPTEVTESEIIKLDLKAYRRDERKKRKERKKAQKEALQKYNVSQVEIEYLNEEDFEEERIKEDKINQKLVKESVEGKTQRELYESNNYFFEGVATYLEIMRMCEDAETHCTVGTPPYRHAGWVKSLLFNEFDKMGKTLTLYAMGVSPSEMIMEAKQCIASSSDDEATEHLYALEMLILQSILTAQQAKNLHEEEVKEWESNQEENWFSSGEDYESMPYSEEDTLEALKAIEY